MRFLAAVLFVAGAGALSLGTVGRFLVHRPAERPDEVRNLQRVRAVDDLLIWVGGLCTVSGALLALASP